MKKSKLKTIYFTDSEYHQLHVMNDINQYDSIAEAILSLAANYIALHKMYLAEVEKK